MKGKPRISSILSKAKEDICKYGVGHFLLKRKKIAIIKERAGKCDKVLLSGLLLAFPERLELNSTEIELSWE
ncbi:hypothetical protein CEXT_445471 [Caerostris extrusa]|uniref:Uncharacterized protein n=1 Tax=Caerostris extrusa TaxID=172846 RepID=A0AAV4QH90_CAEEX|nr:hypothetical protein CEXT_445471 [Caerostris extrusa]